MGRDKEQDRALKHGSSGSTADFAVEGDPKLRERDVHAPATTRAKPLADDEKPDQLADKEKEAEDRQEALIDEAIEETFPGSDPISPKHIT